MKDFSELLQRAKNAGCELEVAQYAQNATTILESKTKNIAILGETNVGKTTLINHLVGHQVRKASVTSTGEDPWVVVAETNTPQPDFQVVAMGESPLAQSQVALYEIPINLALNKGNKMPTALLEHMDLVIYIISALTPFTAEDIANLNIFAPYIPTIIFVSKTDVLESQEEKDDVYGYVEQLYRQTFGQMYLVKHQEETSLSQQLLDILENLSLEELREFHVLQLQGRGNHCIKQVLEQRLASLEELEAQHQQATEALEEAQRKQDMAWKQLEIEVGEKKNATVAAMRTMLGQSQEKLVEQITDIVKQYQGRKGQPSPRINTEIHRVFEAKAQEAKGIMEETLTHHMDWLQLQLKKRFDMDMALESQGVMDVSTSFQDFYQKKQLVAPSNKTVIGGAIAGGAVASTLLLPTALVPLAWVVAIPSAVFAIVSLVSESKAKEAELHQAIADYCNTCRDKLSGDLEEIAKLHYDKLVAVVSRNREQAKPNLEPDETLAEQKADCLAQLQLCEII